jgi:hypothetical protein
MSKDSISLEYLDSLIKERTKILNSKPTPRHFPLICGVKEIDHRVSQDLFSVDKHNKVWCGKHRVFEDVGLGREPKYNNDK